MSDLGERVVERVDEVAGRLGDVAQKIHARPELSYEERYAANLIATELECDGIEVERGAFGLPTAFRARIGTAFGGARVAICAEYDALPEIGHACGHNLIAAGALGAALALHAVADDLPGEVVLLGTPAEEGGGGKIRLLQAGAFAGVDAALMFHPLDRTVLAQPALAMCRYDLVFHGKASHGAAAPWDGESALRGVIQTFNLVDSARLHLRDGVRVHGIVTDGGKAVNVIPERAAASFSVRAPTVAQLATVEATLRRCAEAAALATGTRLEVTRLPGYRDMRNNMPLARRFGEKLAALSVPFAEHDASIGAGSTDMGDVSHACPSIHPYVAICEPNEAFCHQVGFAERTASARGIAAAVHAAKALALTACDVLSDPALRAEARRAFDAP